MITLTATLSDFRPPRRDSLCPDWGVAHFYYAACPFQFPRNSNCRKNKYSNLYLPLDSNTDLTIMANIAGAIKLPMNKENRK